MTAFACTFIRQAWPPLSPVRRLKAAHVPCQYRALALGISQAGHTATVRSADTMLITRTSDAEV